MTHAPIITIETIVAAPLSKVWECWTKPEHITKWAFASDDWESPFAENDLIKDGKFKTVMSAKDKSAGFDFNGVYTNVKENELIEYTIEGGRTVKIEFIQTTQGVKIIQTFEAETENPLEMQRDGWQSILNNFKKHTEQL